MSTDPTTPPLQDPEKRHAILDAAFKVFSKKGFRHADIEEIAEIAGVGKGTIYRYFGNKEAFFRATAESGMKRLEEHIFAALDGIDDPLEIIRRAAISYAEFFQRHPELVEILILERAEFRGSIPDTHLVYREKNRSVIDRVIRRGIEAGRFRRLNVHEAANALANMLYGTVVCGCLEGASRKLKRASEHCVDIFLNGLLARDGKGS